MTTETADCVIVGGGAAGLITSVYLGRFRRKAVVIDAGESRARWIPTSHNIPGFPDGINGMEFLQRVRAQALRYGADLRRGIVEAVTIRETGFTVTGPGLEIVTPTVVIATGVKDRMPPIPDAERAVDDGLLRFCPVCDGYEAIDRRVGVLGPLDHALGEARYLTTFSRDVTVLLTERPTRAFAGGRSSDGIAIAPGVVRSVETLEDAVAIETDAGFSGRFETVYPAMGTDAQSQLAGPLALETNAAGCLVTDPHQRTRVDGIYAVGDVVNELNQIAVAAGHAAIAGTDIHNRLRRLERHGVRM